MCLANAPAKKPKPKDAPRRKTETENASDPRRSSRIWRSARRRRRAATAAAALKHGPDESADGAREEAIARAVRRAVDAALAREGIEVMEATPRE